MGKAVLPAIVKYVKGYRLGNALKHAQVFGLKALNLVLSGTR